MVRTHARTGGRGPARRNAGGSRPPRGGGPWRSSCHGFCPGTGPAGGRGSSRTCCGVLQNEGRRRSQAANACACKCTGEGRWAACAGVDSSHISIVQELCEAALVSNARLLHGSCTNTSVVSDPQMRLPARVKNKQALCASRQNQKKMLIPGNRRTGGRRQRSPQKTTGVYAYNRE